MRACRAGTLLAILGAASAGAVVVDDFTGAAQAVSTAGTSANQLAGPGIGGERDLEVSLLGGSGAITADVNSTTATALNFAVPAGDRGRVLASYDGADADAALTTFSPGLANVDLTASGAANALRLTFDSVTGAIEVIVEVFSDVADDGVTVNASKAVATVAAAGDLVFGISGTTSDFTASRGAGADFSAVDAVTVELTASGGGSGASADVSLVETVGPGLTSLKADALAIDLDSDLVADPGDTLEYTVTIDNTGGEAPGADFDDTPTLATVVPGTVNVSPLAVNDRYDAIGNVQLSVSAPGVLANDREFAGEAIGVDTFIDDGGGGFPIAIATLQGGSASLAADGSFSYDPPLGFTGVDSFGYTLVDPSSATGAGTVSILVSELVWFVDSSHTGVGSPFGCAGAGTLADPFEDFDCLNGTTADVDSPGDTIFVFAGSGYDEPVPLENDQTLIGEEDGLSVGPLSVPAGSAPLLTNSAGDAITLAEDNTVRGLDVGDTPAAASAFRGAADVGALKVSNVDVSGTGGILQLAAAGALDVTFGNVASTSSSGTAAISLSAVSGSLTVNNPGMGLDTAISDADAGISISGSAGASFSFGDTGVVTDATGGDGINLTTSAGATFTFDSLAVTAGNGNGLLGSGASTLNVGGAGSTIGATGGAALDLSSMALGNGLGGALTFASLSSVNSAGDGVRLDATSGSFTVTGTTTAANPGAEGIDITSSAATFTFGNLDIDDAGTAGINVNGVTGQVSFSGASKAITDTAATGGDGGAGVQLVGSDVDFTGGGLDIDTTTGIGFSATTGGTVNVTGSANTIVTTTGTGVRFSGNALLGAGGVTFQSVSVNGATVGIDIASAGSTGSFTVTGTGTTDGSGGTIQNTTQNGVLIASTDNISLSNMNLTSAAGDGGGAGSCDETTFTGCNAAIELATVANVDLVNLTITGSQDHGIFGQTVTDLDISDTDITGLGADVDTDEHGIFVRDLLGTTAGGTASVFDNLTIDDAQDTAILIQNTTATNPGNTASPDLVTVSNSALTDAGDSGLNVQTTAANGNLELVAAGNTITNTVDGVDAEASAGNLQATVGGAGGLANAISAGAGGDMVNGISFFASAANGAATVDATATNNTITLDAVKVGGVAPVSGLNGVGVSASGAPGNLGTIRATVNDNTINSTFAGILTQTVHGVFVTNDGTGTSSQNVISVDNNAITLNPPPGTPPNPDPETVGVGVDGGTTGAGTTVRVTNNVIIATGDATNGASVGIQILPTELGDPINTGTTVCTRVTGNDVSTPNNPFAGAFLTTELDVIAAPVASGSDLEIEGLVPPPPLGVITPAQLKAEVEPLNTNTEVGDTTGLIAGTITSVASCPI